MSAFQVSSVVDSILTAFTNGMDIFTRMKTKSNRKHRKSASTMQQELKLHDSLSNRPKEIEAGYAQSVVRHGQQFEKGDDIAYSTLARTLLVLNTGLMNLINNALSLDVADKSASRQSLLRLSESAAMDTMHALSQLDARLTASREITHVPYSKPDRRTPTRQIQQSPPTTTRPPPSPLLARGGWVRSRSGSSVVSAVAARKLSEPDNDSGGRKGGRGSPKASTTSKNVVHVPPKVFRTEFKDDVHFDRAGPRPTKDSRTVFEPKLEPRPDMQRQPSMLLVPADFFNSAEAASYNSHYAPPKPPKIPLHIRSNPRTGPRPTSAATFMTASTKIGEIPEHKWPDRVLTEEEVEQYPLPYVIPPPLQPPKKKSRGLRLWKKSERRGEAVAVC